MNNPKKESSTENIQILINHLIGNELVLAQSIKDLIDKAQDEVLYINENWL